MRIRLRIDTNWLCFVFAFILSSLFIFAVYPAGNIVEGCPPCNQCQVCQGGVCVPAPSGTSCSGCSGSCGTVTSTCGGGSCTFSSSGGSCLCDGSGNCNLSGGTWWCEPKCPSGVSTQCTVTCERCRNTKVCEPGGGSGDNPPGCTPCICQCNGTGLTAPSRAPNLLNPSSGSVFTNEVITFSWEPLGFDEWGKNVKRCGNGYCGDYDGDPGAYFPGGFNCPSGANDDPGEHTHIYAFYLWNSSNTNNPPIHTSYTNSTSLTSAGMPFSSCTTYYWAVRPIHINPVLETGWCFKADKLGPLSPVRSFRTNCAPQVISVTPNNQISGRYSFGSEGFPDVGGVSCNRNNPRQFTMIVEDQDGINDINFAGIFINDLNSTGVSTNTYTNSVHGLVKKGTFIIVAANGTQAYNVYPEMRLFVGGTLVKVWQDVGRNGKDRYYYYSPNAVRGSDIKIAFTNDAWNPDFHEDRNLTEVSVYLNTQRINIIGTNCYNGAQDCGYINTGMLYRNGEFTFDGSTYIGRNEFSLYGFKYESALGLSGGLGSWKNYNWGIPLNGYIPSDNKYITTMRDSDGYTDLIDSDINSSSFKGHIKLDEVADISATRKRFVFSVIFGGDNSSKIADNLKIMGYVADNAGAVHGWVQMATHRLDFTPPTGSISMSVLTQNVINVLWDSADSNGIAGTSILSGFNPTTAGYDGDTGVFSTGKPLLINAGVLGKGDPTQVWLGNGEDDGVGTINIASVDDAGEFNSELVAADTLCNVNTFDTVDGIRLGASWYISKGGLAYSRGSYYSPLVAYAEGGSIHSSLGINKEEVNISSELLGSGNAAFVDEQDNLTRPFMIKNFNSVINSGYTRYRDVVLSKVQAYPEKYQQIAYSSDALSGNISTQCPDANKLCVLVRNGKLNIDNPLVCDRKTVVITSSDLTVSKGVTSTGDLNGCIFLSGNDIDIKAFYGAVPLDVEYDIINGFFIADNQIHIENDLANQPRGLRVVGSMIGFSDTNSGIKINRSLQLRQNLEYPSVAVEYDNRYYILSREFFGLIEVYRKDSGYKPY